MYLGIDPGWSSFGYAQVDGNGELLSIYDTGKPKDHGITTFISTVLGKPEGVVSLTMERFVPYDGMYTTATETVTMMIGALQYHYELLGIKVHLFRAIEWKPALCKWLVKNKGFKNPSIRFDKEFSIAAAECLCGKSIKSDHRADAICLAYLGYIYGQQSNISTTNGTGGKE